MHRTCISQPFVGESGDLMISLSTPIRSPENKKVLGLLVGSFFFDDLKDWLVSMDVRKGNTTLGGTGFPVVLNERGNLLHRGKEKIDMARDKNPVDLSQQVGLYHTVLHGTAEDGTDSDFVDPEDGQHYLAAYCRFSGKSTTVPAQWAVIVQHNQNAVLYPIEDLTRRINAFSWIAIGVIGVLIPGLWGWLIWTLRREERKAHG